MRKHPNFAVISVLFVLTRASFVQAQQQQQQQTVIIYIDQSGREEARYQNGELAHIVPLFESTFTLDPSNVGYGGVETLAENSSIGEYDKQVSFRWSVKGKTIFDAVIMHGMILEVGFSVKDTKPGEWHQVFNINSSPDMIYRPHVKQYEKMKIIALVTGARPYMSKFGMSRDSITEAQVHVRIYPWYVDFQRR